MDIYTWHRQVRELLEQQNEDVHRNGGLGRMWERLASEIFLVNSDTPLWGWADEASSHLLDFWHDFDPRLHFVLLFVRAETVVAAHMEQSGAQALTLEQSLAAWRQRHEALLTFGLRFPKRCLLLDAGEVLANPAELLNLLSAKWGLPLSLPEAIPSMAVGAPNPMTLYLAGQLLRRRPEMEALQQEIDASLARLSPGATQASSAALQDEELIDGFRQLLDRSVEQQQIKLLQEQCLRVDQLHQRTLASYQQLYQDFQLRDQESHSRLQHFKQLMADMQAQHDQQVNAINSELQAAKASAEQREKVIRVLEEKLHSSVEENELVQAQLHQTQEELELSFLLREEHKQSSSEQQKALQLQLIKEHKEHDQQRIQLMEALEQRLRESTEENEQILLQLNQAYEEMELLFLRGEKQRTVNEANIAKNKSLQDQLEHATKTADGQIKLLHASQDRITQLDRERRKLQDEFKLLKERETRQADIIRRLEQSVSENDRKIGSLSIHLREAQDDLEHTFLKLNALEDQRASLEVRLRKMQQLYPDYVECGSVEVVAGENGRLNWCLRGLALVGRDFNELRFATVLEHGMVGLVFSAAEPHSRRFFDDWQLVGGERQEITLLPLGRPEQVGERSAALLALGTSEWLRLMALVDFLSSLLARKQQPFKAPEGFEANQWRGGLTSLKADLAQFPAIPRFDQIRLKRQQINPDYEHLWLSLENFSLGERHWPSFEFRVSCANAHLKNFGAFPKLEFPYSSIPTPFDSWFAESVDDFGEKLELRYALPDAMDLGIWHKLSRQDQSFVRQVIRFLPHWLQRLPAMGVRLSRPWQDWYAMVETIQKITARHTTARKNTSLPSVANPAAVAKSALTDTQPRQADPVLVLLDTLEGRLGKKSPYKHEKGVASPTNVQVRKKRK